MALFCNNHYIILECSNGELECLLSHENLKDAKRHAKEITEQINKTCLIVKPIAKVISNTQWTIKDYIKRT